MFIGHYAVALAAKKIAPRPSLGTLFLSVQFLDLLWPILLLLGVEHVRIDPGNTAFTPYDFYDYPVSHSLFSVVVWSAAFGVLYYAIRRDAKSAFVLGAGVLSHWVLDFITHRPDLPIMPGMETYIGLGLWNSVVATILVEGGLFGIALVLYARVTVAADATGRYALWSLAALLVLIWISSVLGPPAPDEGVLAVSGLAGWLIIPWGYWIDRHRKLKQGSTV